MPDASHHQAYQSQLPYASHHQSYQLPYPSHHQSYQPHLPYASPRESYQPQLPAASHQQFYQPQLPDASHRQSYQPLPPDASHHQSYRPQGNNEELELAHAMRASSTDYERNAHRQIEEARRRSLLDQHESSRVHRYQHPRTEEEDLARVLQFSRDQDPERELRNSLRRALNASHDTLRPHEVSGLVTRASASDYEQQTLRQIEEAQQSTSASAAFDPGLEDQMMKEALQMSANEYIDQLQDSTDILKEKKLLSRMATSRKVTIRTGSLADGI
ncbi:hypothetical protein PTTG_25691 [Puccinia triticina 1-1 BBBD Race 1]|uniref:Uncharacterized protein n=2 Tax=Puccinia triticina TaxID=208348 RepID=A0A180GZD5_PUCT1|nr:uncharacterized protein PtA15_8A320 [Puccinia triticina]OAV98185.1 hypothetical protein PTTG_25691 [Puccinia triticina 1-1 BBBD Race 1]WAQ87416.1 hypothetical protein PtA15_8A320 [Puccinia triticina]WAR57269.1 hypothetical protein PtB15_8B316 [Puccinia triticina]